MPPVITHTTIEWLGGERFAGGAPNGPKAFMDGEGASAPSPVVTLLNAAASCAATDVVLILAKKKVELKKLTVEVAADRRETAPRRVLALTLVWRLAGSGLDLTKARHAIDLSVEKYCSVMSSLNPDIKVTNEIHLG
ncbi:MAG TPA: OsmC family protein [Gemmatimonadales bacterium]|nr:OsmC family protein [Gemmatimonadales bacterium]